MSSLLKLVAQRPRLYASLLAPTPEQTGPSLDAVAETLAAAASPAHEVAEMLRREEWREQIVGTVALLLLDQRAGGPPGVALEALWEAVGRRSWIGPQLAATAFLADPHFARHASTHLVWGVEHGGWSSNPYWHKTLSSLAALAGYDESARDWIEHVTERQRALDLLAEDPHGGGELAWGWIRDMEPLLRRRSGQALRELKGALEPPRWTVEVGDILDVDADVLICSANPWLRLTGGVGGALLVRYGGTAQEELRTVLERRRERFVRQGGVVPVPGAGTPYRGVVHAVAIDPFYRTSPDVVSRVAADAIRVAAGLGARRVALTALGTGFGRLLMAGLGEALGPVRGRIFPPVADVVVRVQKAEHASVLGDTMRRT